MNCLSPILCPPRHAVYEAGAPPVRSAELDQARRVGLRHFRDASAQVEHPPLRDNVLSIHLGGPKRITRMAGRLCSVREVEVGALTILPALHAYRWRTEGPVEFAQLTLPASLLYEVALEEFDSASAELCLTEALGFRSPLIEQALLALLADIDRKRAGRLYREGLLTSLIFALLRDHSNIGMRAATADARRRRGGLTVRALSRVVAHMEAHLHEDIGPAELIGQTGLSRAQFYRAFKQSTGLTPGEYLAVLRRTRARRLQIHAGLPAEEAGLLTGLHVSMP